MKDGRIVRSAEGRQSPSSRYHNFPMKLHIMLEETDRQGETSIVSWLPEGRGFVVKDADKFVSVIMPKYFQQTKLAHFIRQLNMYQFARVKNDRGMVYHHDSFVRGNGALVQNITRIKCKGTRKKIGGIFQKLSPPTTTGDVDLGSPTTHAPLVHYHTATQMGTDQALNSDLNTAVVQSQVNQQSLMDCKTSPPAATAAISGLSTPGRLEDEDTTLVRHPGVSSLMESTSYLQHITGDEKLGLCLDSRLRQVCEDDWVTTLKSSTTAGAKTMAKEGLLENNFQILHTTCAERVNLNSKNDDIQKLGESRIVTASTTATNNDNSSRLDEIGFSEALKNHYNSAERTLCVEKKRCWPMAAGPYTKMEKRGFVQDWMTLTQQRNKMEQHNQIKRSDPHSFIEGRGSSSLENKSNYLSKVAGPQWRNDVDEVLVNICIQELGTKSSFYSGGKHIIGHL